MSLSAQFLSRHASLTKMLGAEVADLALSCGQAARECYEINLTCLGSWQILPHERINKTCVNAFALHNLQRVKGQVGGEDTLRIEFYGFANAKDQDPLTALRMYVEGTDSPEDLIRNIKGIRTDILPPLVKVPNNYGNLFTANPLWETSLVVNVAQQINDWHAGRLTVDLIKANPRADALQSEFILAALEDGCEDTLTIDNRRLLADYPRGWQSLPAEENGEVKEVMPGIFSALLKDAPYDVVSH